MSDSAGLLNDLTAYEVLALESEHNLSDGHTHFSPSTVEWQIVDRLPQIWRAAARRTQAAVDADLVRALAEFHQQPAMLTTGRPPLIAYASSISMGVVSAYLARRGCTVSLLEPCFDNLYEILGHYGIQPVPLPEEVVFTPESSKMDLGDIETGEVLVIVDPNNPTGSTAFLNGGSRFRRIVEFCVEHEKLLVLDLSFSSFLRGPNAPGRPDVYSILEESGVSYITIEDTGKTWPSQDIKCGMILSSSDVYEDLRAIHTGVLLNTSPVASAIITEFIRASIDEGFQTIPKLLERNRDALRRMIEGAPLRMIEPMVPVSVSLLKILDGRDAADIQALLAAVDVHVLPGQHFFWADRRRGSSFIRIALARDPLPFARAVEVLVNHL